MQTPKDGGKPKNGGMPGRKIEVGSFRGKEVTFLARRLVIQLAASEDEKLLMESVATLMAKAKGARVMRGPSATGRILVMLPEGQSVIEWAARFSDERAVAYAEPDMLERLQIVPNDTLYSSQWSPGMVNAEQAWDLETGKTNVIIGIIDSGISITGGALDHDDLNTPGRFVLGTDFVDGGTPRDLNGHGTHVTGIAAAMGDNGTGIAGMNWGSQVYICRTFDAGGNGSSADFADAVEEITDFAVANGLKAVINYSGGGVDNQTKQDAATYASNNGMLLVAATGNDNGGPVIFPAAYSTTITGVIAVGSTDSNDTVSGFSNVGPEVTVVAPGGDILSTTPTYNVTLSGPPANLALNHGNLSGTSMATPMVTGLAALMWSRHPSHTNQKVKQCLIDTAVKLGSGNFDNSWGFGRIDAYAALKCGDWIMPSKLILCKSRLVLCTSKLSTCRTQLSVCKSKLTICSSQLVICKSQLTVCKSQLTLCGKSQLVLCPTKSFLDACPVRSVLAACPSAVDACPSTPGGCEFVDPRELLVDPLIRIAGLEYRLQELKTELWYGAGAAKAPDAGDDDGWFVLDDGGNIHLI